MLGDAGEPGAETGTDAQPGQLELDLVGQAGMGAAQLGQQLLAAVDEEPEGEWWSALLVAEPGDVEGAKSAE